MPKVYDPILCMMVDKPATRTTDAKATDKAGEMWFLKVDGKTIKAFEKWGAPVAEAKKYMRENNIPGVGILKRLGRSGEYTITAKDSTVGNAAKAIDAAMQAMDFEFGNGEQLRRNKQALESIRKLAQNLTKSDDVLHDFKVMQMTASQITDKKVKAEADRIVASIKGKLASIMR